MTHGYNFHFKFVIFAISCAIFIDLNFIESHAAINFCSFKGTVVWPNVFLN